MTDIRRMNAQEQRGMINLLGILSQTAFLENDVGRRIERIPRGKFRLKGALSNLTRLANDLALTLPEEQRAHLRRQLPAIKMIVGATAQLPRNYDSTYGRWLSFEDLDVVAEAVRECCRTCVLDDPQRQKQCPFCKLLDKLPTDKPDEHAPGCGYFSIW